MRPANVTTARRTIDGTPELKRTILGFGGAIEQCGALRLTEADGDESEVSNCSTSGDTKDGVASCETEDVTGPPMLNGHSRTPSIPTRLSTLFDADFDVKLDAETGRWVVSNVDVIRRS